MGNAWFERLNTRHSTKILRWEPNLVMMDQRYLQAYDFSNTSGES